MNLFGRLCVLAAAGAALGVTGCGSVSGTTTTGHDGRPASTPAATAAGLCAAVSEVDSLTVIRDVAFPGNHLRFRFPSRVTTDHPQQAQAVARAVCALPQMPRGTIACPADLGVSYRLGFAAGGQRFGVVTVDAGGCQQVSGAGPVRWLLRSPGFWTVLERATGVPGPGAFLGCGGATGLMCPQGASQNP
jgi:hypothetical protein